MARRSSRIIAKLKGGLGNQQFIYATAFAIARRAGCALELDEEYLRRDRVFCRAFRLDHFAISAPRRYVPSQAWSAHLLGAARRVFNGGSIVRETRAKFVPDIIALRPSTTLELEGLWQSEKYFLDATEALLCEFTLRTPLSAKALRILNEIQNRPHSAALHVRRYRDVPNAAERRAMPDTYYQTAVTEVRKRFPLAHWFVFTDSVGDLNELTTKLGSHEVVSLQGTENTDVEEQYLMSCCRHFVVPNSSFSWWAAWLSQQSRGRPDRAGEQRIICGPSHGAFHTDFLPNWWQMVGV